MGIKGHGRPRVKFERHASRVVFDPGQSKFVVSWTKCGVPKEVRAAAGKDLGHWRPSVSAIATLYERGQVSGDMVLPAAEAIGMAYDTGDRELLDTEEAKRAAEMVRDLAAMKAGRADIGQAIRTLLDEMARVRFSSAPCEAFDDNVMSTMSRAVDECFSISGFSSWPPVSMRRRMLYCLNKKERNEVSYTLAALLFDCGACPLLPVHDRRSLRTDLVRKSNLAAGMTRDSAMAFLRMALDAMRDAKSCGKSSVGVNITQKQLVDGLYLERLNSKTQTKEQ